MKTLLSSAFTYQGIKYQRLFPHGKSILTTCTYLAGCHLARTVRIGLARMLGENPFTTPAILVGNTELLLGFCIFKSGDIRMGGKDENNYI